MQIEKNIENNQLSIKPIGRLDAITSNDLDNEVQSLDENIQLLILDLSETEYISSAGLRSIANILKTSKSKNIDFITKNPNVNVMTVLKMTGFDAILKIQ